MDRSGPSKFPVDDVNPDDFNVNSPVCTANSPPREKIFENPMKKIWQQYWPNLGLKRWIETSVLTCIDQNCFGKQFAGPELCMFIDDSVPINENFLFNITDGHTVIYFKTKINIPKFLHRLHDNEDSTYKWTEYFICFIEYRILLKNITQKSRKSAIIIESDNFILYENDEDNCSIHARLKWLRRCEEIPQILVMSDRLEIDVPDKRKQNWTDILLSGAADPSTVPVDQIGNLSKPTISGKRNQKLQTNKPTAEIPFLRKTTRFSSSINTSIPKANTLLGPKCSTPKRSLRLQQLAKETELPTNSNRSSYNHSSLESIEFQRDEYLSTSRVIPKGESTQEPSLVLEMSNDKATLNEEHLLQMAAISEIGSERSLDISNIDSEEVLPLSEVERLLPLRFKNKHGKRFKLCAIPESLDLHELSIEAGVDVKNLHSQGKRKLSNLTPQDRVDKHTLHFNETKSRTANSENYAVKNDVSGIISRSQQNTNSEMDTSQFGKVPRISAVESRSLKEANSDDSIVVSDDDRSEERDFFAKPLDSDDKVCVSPEYSPSVSMRSRVGESEVEDDDAQFFPNGRVGRLRLSVDSTKKVTDSDENTEWDGGKNNCFVTVTINPKNKKGEKVQMTVRNSRYVESLPSTEIQSYRRILTVELSPKRSSKLQKLAAKVKNEQTGSTKYKNQYLKYFQDAVLDSLKDRIS